MKRILVIALAVLLLIMNIAFAQEAAGSDAFVVGSATPMSGHFFTDMWGNNTSDNDVRTLLRGYNTVALTSDVAYEFDPMVVSGNAVTQDKKGNKTYVIQLQKDLTFNDGTPITAADYVFSILLSGSPAIAQLGGIITAPSALLGYDAYAKGESAAFAGVRLLDTYQFSITIRADFLPYFYEMKLLDWAPYPISVIAPGCEVADDGDGAYIKGDFTKDLLTKTLFDPETGYMSNPKVTCGPYQLVSYDPEKAEARFEINPLYKGEYDGRKPSIPNIVFRAEKTQQMIGDLQSGEVQLLNKVTDGQAISDGMALFGQTIAASNYLRSGFGFISFACEKGPAQFQAVRQAVAHCLDTDQFTADFTHGYGQAVHGYMGYGQWMVRALEGMLTTEMGEQNPAAWEKLSLGELSAYAKDLEAAKALLVADGWTLNSDGGEYVEGKDAIRYKKVGGELMALNLNWAKVQDSAAAGLLEAALKDSLPKVGIGLTVTEVPFAEMLTHYYRQTDRTYDMFYLATNFDEVFDPYLNFNTGDEYQGAQNTTGLRDEALMRLAKEMRETEPGDFLGYCTKWIAFQQKWNELLPMIPLYSNVYFDFYTPELTGYYPNLYTSWASAIVYAQLGADEA